MAWADTTRTLAVVVATTACACGPDAPASDGSAPSTSTSGTIPTPTSTTFPDGPASSTSGDAFPPVDEGVADDDDDDVTDGGFIMHKDGQPPHGCDVTSPDCDAGEKCTLVSTRPGEYWNGTMCVPVARDPAGPGEPCVVQDHATSGLDDCEAGSICLVTSDDLTGYCEDFCSGPDHAPVCAQPGDVCTICAACKPFCVATCDPLAPGCPLAQQTCMPLTDQWVCGPLAADAATEPGSPCAFQGECGEGLVCLGAAAFSACAGAFACCSPLCSVSDPTADAACQALDAGQSCERWYIEGMAPDGLDDVGVCALPA